EAVLQLDRPVAPVLKSLSNRGILGGLDLSGYFPELGDALLVCATETKTSADIDRYRACLSEVMQAARAACIPSLKQARQRSISALASVPAAHTSSASPSSGK